MEATEDRYMAQYLNTLQFSEEAQKVLKQAENVYRLFYEESASLTWPKFKISTWDVGWYQIRMSLLDKNIGEEELTTLSLLHKELGKQILPRLKQYGFVGSYETFFVDEMN